MSFINLRWLMLLACLVVGAPLGTRSPGYTPDESWGFALNAAHDQGLQFGKQALFTYGPWGFLDAPLNLHRVDLLLGTLFTVATVGLAWLAFHRALRRVLTEGRAAVLAAVLVPVLASNTEMSGLLLLAVTMHALDHVASEPEGRRHGWLPAAVGATAGLLLLVKFSEGIVLALVAVLAAAFGPTDRVRRAGEAIAAFVVAVFALWMMDGQPLGNFAHWLHGALQVTAGYPEAMAYEVILGRTWTYLLLGLAAVTLVVFLVQTFRTTSRRVAVGTSLIGLGVFYLGFREGYDRHDPGHQHFFFVIAVGLLTWFGTMPRDGEPLRRLPRLIRAHRRLSSAGLTGGAVLAGCVVAREALHLPLHKVLISLVLLLVAAWLFAATPALATRAVVLLLIAVALAAMAPNVNPADSVTKWAQQARTFVDDGYRQRQNEAAAAAARNTYAVSPQLLQALAHRPVHIDNYDTSLAWAYGLNWHPAPVFQDYSAYTPYLDRLNADAIGSAPSTQMILRRQQTIDGRNPMWDSPRYVVAELCDYRAVGNDATWLLLAKAADRCAAGRVLGDRTAVSAGQRISVPDATASEAVIMSFTPSSPSLPEQLIGAVYKRSHPLFVRLQSAVATFRLPRAFADGPLLVRIPPIAGWPAAFGGTMNYKTVSFSEAGTVQFRTLQLRGPIR